MSGIAGIFRLDGRPVDPDELHAMVARIAHRGPDGAGEWRRGPTGLGHQRMCVTPESLSERQPYEDAASGLVVTADARIDNRDELIARLGLGDRLPGTIPDSELILRAYERWGEECPKELLGDFAFAVWDPRRERLFAARDPFGVRPFYYHHAPGRLFAFGSEIKCILALPEVPRRLNEVRVADFLAPFFGELTATFYRGILRLPGGHRLTVTPGRIRIEPYWSLDPSKEIHLGSDGEYAEAMQSLFEETVRCRLRSCHPVGSTLSGGLDSSSIVAVARRVLASKGCDPLHTFSGRFDTVPEADERVYIDLMLAEGLLNPHFVRADQIPPLWRVEDPALTGDEPSPGYNLFMHWALYSAAAEAGVRVFFDGLGGDQCAGQGYQFIGELTGRGHWLRAVRETQSLARRAGKEPTRLFIEHGIRGRVPEPLRRLWRWATGRRGLPHRLNPILKEEFIARVQMRERIAAVAGERLSPARNARLGHYHRIIDGANSTALEWTNRAASAMGIEPVYPLFDRRIVEFCLGLPWDQKTRNGFDRWVMRRAMEPDLPAEVVWRGRKQNLTPNLARNLLALNGAELERGRKLVATQLAEYVDVMTFEQVYQRYLLNGSANDAVILMTAVSMAQWLPRSGLTR